MDRRNKAKRVPPKGKFLKRLNNLLASFTVMADESELKLPELREHQRTFPLTEDEEKDTNGAFSVFKSAAEEAKLRVKNHASGVRKSNKRKRSRGQMKPSTKLERLSVLRRSFKRKARVQNIAVAQTRQARLAALTLAQQHAYHPSLTDIMRQVRVKTMEPSEEEEDLKILSDEAAEAYTKWLNWLSDDGNWRSSRVDEIVSIVNQLRDLDPERKILIVDPLVYFLDILAVGLTMMAEPIEVYRYDGRSSVEIRDETLERFTAKKGPAVLLLSRAAGGLEVNITAATAVILCGPLWKRSLELQAFKRAYRRGQTMPVDVFYLIAMKCWAEAHIREKRDTKNKHSCLIEAKLVQKPEIYARLR